MEARLGSGWLVGRLEVGLVVTLILPIGGFVLEANPGGSSAASGISGFSLILIIHEVSSCSSLPASATRLRFANKSETMDRF